ncbi:TPA: hypothetical protein ACPJ2D_000468 [Vibrio alginolyticus]
MNDDLVTFGKYFNKIYLHDLIERHTTATKSQNERNAGIEIDHHNPLNTMKLNKLSTKNYKASYTNVPLKHTKIDTLIETDQSNPVIITSKLDSIASFKMLAYLRTPTDSQEELTLNRPQLLPC